METLFDKGLVNNDNEEMNILIRYINQQKIKDNKWKVIIIGIFLILFCLILFLFV